MVNSTFLDRYIPIIFRFCTDRECVIDSRKKLDTRATNTYRPNYFRFVTQKKRTFQVLIDCFELKICRLSYSTFYFDYKNIIPGESGNSCIWLTCRLLFNSRLNSLNFCLRKFREMRGNYHAWTLVLLIVYIIVYLGKETLAELFKAHHDEKISNSILP